MRSRWTLLLAACAAVLVFVASGCGGGDDDSSSSTTSTTTTTASTENVRLSQADWERYEQEKASAQEVNQAAIKTFDKCRKLVDSGASQEQVETCFGDSTSSVVAEGQKLLTFIADIGQDVGGDCATATGNLHNSVKLYISSVNAIGLSSEGGTVPTIQTVDSAKRTLVAARADVTAFENACKPA